MPILDEITGSFGGMGLNYQFVTNLIISIFQLAIFGVIAIFVLRWYLRREKYSMVGEIWIMQEGAITPIIEHIRGGWFDEKGLRDFRVMGNKYKNIVTNMNPKHLIRDGKKFRFWLRQAGSREYYSFIPRIWVNKEGKSDFVLEVEDSSIVNQAIMKDKAIRERQKAEDKLKEYLPIIVQMVGYFAIIIVAYFSFQYLSSALADVNSMRQACEAAINSGGW